MKFSYRQILASAAGAVLSAVIASVFGVKGTIVGVALGSIAATTGTALAFQSIERTNKAVKQVVVRAPETSLLRRLGGTNAAGITESTPGDSSAPTEETGTSAATAPDAAPETAPEPAPEPAPAGSAATLQMASPSEPPEPPASAPPADVAGSRPGGVRWPVVLLLVFGVFVVSLLFVTVVELIAGRPLADLFGHGGGGTTVERIFENNPTTTLPPPTTTTTTTTTSSSTTTSTSTTAPSSSTTTSLGGSTTSTTGPGSTSTTSPSGTSTTTVSGTTGP